MLKFKTGLYSIWKLNTYIQTKNMYCQDLVKCTKKKAVIILNEWIKIYLFYKKDESEIIEFCSEFRILFNNSEELHTTMSIKMHLHIKATKVFSTQEIYNKDLICKIYVWIMRTMKWSWQKMILSTLTY